MKEMIQELIQYRHLLYMLTWRDIKIKYKQSIMGFFIASIRFAVNSLVSNMNLITKIYFPREVFPLAAVMGNFFDFAVASILLIIILSIAGIGASIYLVWLPLLLILLISLAAGLGMLLSCANLFFRDVKYIVEVLLTMGIFFTPVFYEAEMFGKWAPVLLLNPVGAILESINAVVVLHQPPDMFWLGYSAIWAIGGLFIAWIIFHRAEFAFAENI